MGVRVALPRFTIFVAPQRGRPGRPLRSEDLDSHELPLCWRLLAANNRDVARSATAYTELEACLDAIADLQARITDAVAVATRAGRADWSWRLRLDGDDVAVSSRTYQRRLQCEAACSLFVVLVGDATLDVFGHGDAHGSANGVVAHVHAQPSAPAAVGETTGVTDAATADRPTSPPNRPTTVGSDKSGRPQP
jgi:uncharacterized protein YegP (UPF0339 family)